MTTADDKVTALPSLLERLGLRIDQAWQRTREGEGEWIDGSLELAQALAEGRGRFRSDTAFGVWLKESGHHHVSHQGRAALINFASDISLAREILTETASRSYELIWRANGNRFTSVRNPDKPKRGRPRGTKLKPRPLEHRAAAAKSLDEGLTREQISAETGLSDKVVQLSREREIGRREMFTELLDAVAAENFQEKGKLRIEDAIRIHQKRLDKQFEQVVNTEVRRRIDAANDAMRANYARLSQENLNLTRIVNQRGVFTETQYKQMLVLCHPDSSASPQLKAELLQVLIQNKMRLVKQ